MQKEKRGIVFKQNYHSQKSLSGIPTLNTQSKEDPRQRHLGMTACCNTPHLAFGHPLPQGLRKTALGFTLIELLVVVLIIGILAAVALPQYQKAVLKTRMMATVALGDAIYKAEELYYLANGQYATSMEDLEIETPIDETKYLLRFDMRDNGHAAFTLDLLGTKLRFVKFLDHHSGENVSKRICRVQRQGNQQEHAVCAALTQKTIQPINNTTYVDYAFD